MTQEPLVILGRFASVLENLEIAYVVGGSFASSVFGTPRSTQDADVVADIPMERVQPLQRALEGDFFVDVATIHEAVTERSSFNILDRATMFKIDVFVSPEDEWSRMRLQRARTEAIETSTGVVAIRFSSPEDTLLHKLVWYRLGGEASERQWDDALGLLRVQGRSLDDAYLDRWSPALGVEDLLARARQQAG